MRETTLSKTELRQYLKWVLPLALEACRSAATLDERSGRANAAQFHHRNAEQCKVIQNQLRRDEKNTTRRTS